MKTNKNFLIILLILCVSAVFSLNFAAPSLAEELDADMFEITHSCEDSDNSSGDVLDRYTFTVNRKNTSWTLSDGYSLEYTFSFDGTETVGSYNSSSFATEKNADLVHTLNVTVYLLLNGTQKEELPLPSLKFKNGELYEEPSVEPEPEEPVIPEPPVLTEENVELTANYDLSGQSYAKYGFTIDLIDVELGDLYGLSTEWTFDGDVFVTENYLEMTTSIDPEKAHSLSAKVSVIKIEDKSVVSSLNLPIRYYKDGKILQNYAGNDVDEALSELFPLNKIILPVIAVLMLIFYCFYFKKERMTGGLDMTIDRLSNILGMTSAIEKTMNNQNLSEKNKLSEMRKIYRNIKLDLNGTLNMLKSSSLEADVSVNTKYAVEKLTGAVDFVNVDYKQYSLEELNKHIEDLLKKHVSPAIGACKQLSSTNKRYLKKYDNEQF